MGRRAAITVGVVVGTLLLAACGGGEGTGPGPTGTATPSPTATTAVPTPTGPSPTATTVSPGALPGEPMGRVQEGRSYAVVGVAHDDVLNVRTGPGPDFAVVAELDPTASAVATGRDRLVETGLWAELEVEGQTGWANYAFLALTGGTFDVTSEVVEANGGERPAGDTMEQLGRRVAALRGPEEPAPRVEVVVPGTTGDLGEITVDVVGLADDAVKGERLKVFGTPGSGQFTLRSVEMTLLCDRGVDGELCV